MRALQRKHNSLRTMQPSTAFHKLTQLTSRLVIPPPGGAQIQPDCPHTCRLAAAQARLLFSSSCFKFATTTTTAAALAQRRPVADRAALIRSESLEANRTSEEAKKREECRRFSSRRRPTANSSSSSSQPSARKFQPRAEIQAKFVNFEDANNMATIAVIFKILFLVLIAHSFVASATDGDGDDGGGGGGGSSSINLLPKRHLRDNDDGSGGSDADSDQRPPPQFKRFPSQPPPPPPPLTTTTESILTTSEQAAAAAAASTTSSNIQSVYETAASVSDDEQQQQQQQQQQKPTESHEQVPAGAGGGGGSLIKKTGELEQVNYAELCYLSNGGSSVTLTVNEATPVGSVIGSIEVNGDPTLEGGNVDLFDVSAPSGTDSATPPPTPLRGSSNSSSSSSSSSGGSGSGGAQEPPASAAFQARHLGQRLQRFLGRRSAPSGGGAGGFPDQPASSSSPASGELAAPPDGPRQHQPAPVNQNGWRESRYVAPGRLADGPPTSFYSLLGAAQSQSQVAAVALAPQPAPVRLEPGTRNLILVRKLDKESPEGEQSLLVNVRCSPRVTPSPSSGDGGAGRSPPAPADSTTIPVRIIITDANDHAPEFQGAQPFVVNISETTPVETVVLRDIEAIDRDSAGPFSTVHYKVLDDPAAPHSSWLQFVNPLVPNLMVAHQLDYETQASFTLTIVAQDEGEPEPLWSSAQLQVNIIDFDDQNPRFLDEKYTLVMDEAQQNLVGQNLQVLPRNLHAEDGDRGINAPILYSFDQLTHSDESSNPLAAAAAAAATTTTIAAAAAAGSDPIPAGSSSSQMQATDNNHQFNVNHYLHLNPSSGEIRLLRQWPSRLMMLGLAPMTLVVRATQADNKDRYTLTTLIVTTTRSGASVAPPSDGGGGGAAASNSSAQSSHHHRKRQQGIEFETSRLNLRVPENAPINEKIARVKARYFQPASSNSMITPVDEQQASMGNNSADQAVDVRQHHHGLSSGSSSPTSEANNKFKRTLLASAEKRPINYQILDDQTDQFGINGLGEIFIKRALDYEQRQEFKFRVLATYLKYSDICQVQVEVMNVNDNKPKFTQPQYTFHVTESRLRSNLIGQVQAHDADLNDSVRYSLSGEQAHLFDIHPSGGQLSLRSSIKQLNITSCQLIVIATDSLAQQTGGQQFSHQARLNLHIAPQLLGRSINFGNSNDDTSATSESTKLFSSRSLTDEGQSPLWLTRQPQQHQQPSSSSSSSNRPKDLTSNQRSSVATVMSSLQHMARSVNFFDMPMSSALLLSALLVFLVCLLFILLVSMSVHIYRRQLKSRRDRRQLGAAAAAHMHRAQLAPFHHQAPASPRQVPNPVLARYLQQSPPGSGGGGIGPSSSSSSRGGSTNSTPANSNSGGHSPPGDASGGCLPNVVTRPLLMPKLSAKVAPAGGRRPASVLSMESGKATDQPAAGSSLEPLQTLSAQLQQRRATLQSRSSASSRQGTGGSGVLQRAIDSSLSSSGLNSRRSYRSTDGDDDDDDDDDCDSSVMHCGHYSVNTSRRQSPSSQHRPQPSNAEPNSMETEGQQSIVREGELRSLGDRTETTDRTDDGRPGIKSYRKLPANLGSMARPTVKFGPTDSSESRRRAGTSASRPGADCGQQQQQDSAIASDESSTAASVRSQTKHADFTGQSEMGLPNEATEATGEVDELRVPSPPLCRTGNLIKWPVPQRVKKLTWDDELSQSNFDATDCYLAPDYGGGGGATTDSHTENYHEQGHMFTGACSPQQPISCTGGGGGGGGDSSFMGQNNCFDYTIVQSSQFQVQDALSSLSTSLSAQHHLLQQQQLQIQQQQRQQTRLLGPKSATYLYSSSSSNAPLPASSQHHQRPANDRGQATPNNQQDLITTAVL